MLGLRLLAVAALFGLSASAKPTPDVDVTVKFADSNPFGRVINGGSSNLLQVRLANHAGEEIVVTRVHGQYREATGKQRALRNTTSLPLRQSVLPGLKTPVIPYKFHSENKIGEVGLRVWVDYLDASKKPHTVLGYDGAVTVVEPPTKWFDPELLLLYLIIGGFLSFVGYNAYGYFVPPPKKGTRAPKKVATPVVAKDSATPGAVGAAYDEEWIPSHVLKPRKGYQSATSGDESEAGKKKKGRK